MPMTSQQLETAALQNVRVVPAEPKVKSAKTRELSLCGVSAMGRTVKTADPTCYDIPVGAGEQRATGCLTKWRFGMQHIYNDGGRAASGFKGSAGDCVCRSIAIVTGLPYKEVYQTLADGTGQQRATRRTAKRPKSARNGINTKRKWFRDCMQRLGLRWHPTMQIGSGCKVHLADGELPNGRLVVSLSGHYTAVINGAIHDTHDPQRDKSYTFEPDCGQDLKANQGRNENGVWTEIGGRCVYGYWTKD